MSDASSSLRSDGERSEVLRTDAVLAEREMRNSGAIPTAPFPGQVSMKRVAWQLRPGSRTYGEQARFADSVRPTPAEHDASPLSPMRHWLLWVEPDGSLSGRILAPTNRGP
jgi:hypothetical protein